MARLFIFAIGGTGSRVLKSLTMLLAAGVKPESEKEFEIIPIIIDPHHLNEDLTRTVRLLENYQAICESAVIDGKENGFFGTKITTLNKLMPNRSELETSFEFNLKQVADTQFKKYIDYDEMSEPGKALADLLFSGKSVDKRGAEIELLEVNMDIGFVGNPNIGSVVLNQFKDSEEFREFASNFSSEDRIFIVSSIFGGTGAAGFPTILKNIRNAKHNSSIDGKGFLESAKIGAITVMPYFNIQKDAQSPIQKSDFIAKTRAALYYYKDNVTGNKSVNALYYIADDFNGKPYPNDPGNKGQKNDAHFIELASALAIIDFLEIPDEKLKTKEGKAEKPIYKEFAIREDTATISFNDLEAQTERKLGLRLSQLTLFWKYLQEHFSKSIGKQAWSNDKPVIDTSFKNEPFFKDEVNDFMEAYASWISELNTNRRSFSPFDLSADLPAFIHHYPATTGFFAGRTDYTLFDGILNATCKNKVYASSRQKLLPLFFQGTEQLLTTKFGLIK